MASIINSTKCNSSPIDTIPTVVLKRCVDIFAPSLGHLPNLSFGAGVFPEKFTLGHVIPLLYKKVGSDSQDPFKYRSITHLITISKILERMVLARSKPHGNNWATWLVSLKRLCDNIAYENADYLYALDRGGANNYYKHYSEASWNSYNWCTVCRSACLSWSSAEEERAISKRPLRNDFSPTNVASRLLHQTPALNYFAVVFSTEATSPPTSLHHRSLTQAASTSLLHNTRARKATDLFELGQRLIRWVNNQTVLRKGLIHWTCSVYGGSR